MPLAVCPLRRSTFILILRRGIRQDGFESLQQSCECVLEGGRSADWTARVKGVTFCGNYGLPDPKIAANSQIRSQFIRLPVESPRLIITRTHLMCPRQANDWRRQPTRPLHLPHQSILPKSLSSRRADRHRHC
jgi:hypothetical protein